MSGVRMDVLRAPLPFRQRVIRFSEQIGRRHVELFGCERDRVQPYIDALPSAGPAHPGLNPADDFFIVAESWVAEGCTCHQLVCDSRIRPYANP